MSTRSLIALKTDTGIHAVYCHHDGYIEHNGEILLNHYTQREQVADLVMHGDMSVLAENVYDCQFYRDAHSKTAVYPNDQALFEQLDGGIEYIYIFHKGDRWAVLEYKSIYDKGVQELSEAVAQNKRRQMHSV